jgi:hypothetical protein
VLDSWKKKRRKTTLIEGKREKLNLFIASRQIPGCVPLK